MCSINLPFFVFISIIFLGQVYSLSFNPYCWIGECCNSDWIKYDIRGLRRVLKQRVHGQHLAETAVDAIAAHWNPLYQPQKALTLSFHGWPGGGKNYVSKFITESLFVNGMKSKFVHLFIGRTHFPLKALTEQYKQQLTSWLKGNVSSCPKQLFIFDEVDKMPPDVLNAIKPMIDHQDNVDGVDFTKTIFIFISNTGDKLINKQYEEFYNTGKRREQLRIADFDNLIIQGAFNEKGGFQYADIIKNCLIDHYIPFLPLHQNHVEMCIKDEFKIRGVDNPREEHIKDVLDSVQWGPDNSKMFAKMGCKTIGPKVGVMAVKHYPEVFTKTEL